MPEMEFYRTEMEFDVSKMEFYRTEVEFYMSKMEFYRTEMEFYWTIWNFTGQYGILLDNMEVMQSWEE